MFWVLREKFRDWLVRFVPDWLFERVLDSTEVTVRLGAHEVFVSSVQMIFCQQVMAGSDRISLSQGWDFELTISVNSCERNWSYGR